jgi:hypothetical protein
MPPPRHRDTDERTRTRPSRTTLGLVVVLVSVLLGVGGAGAFVGTRVVAAGSDAPTASSFEGVVTSFADGGELMCVRPDDNAGAPFCDLFYVQPGTPDIQVGDHVLVTTIATETPDGSPISGMLVSPVP